MEIFKAIRTLINISLLFTVGLVHSQDQTPITNTCAYKLSFVSELDPIEINRMHNWTIHIETLTGIPVEGAAITLEGGMPEHDHGLPTSPRMTAELGSGDYRIEGIRFHMSGVWEITATIIIDDIHNLCVIPLEL